MSSTRLILVRHGQTEANREFRYIGVRDDALTEHGQAQARELAEALSMLPIAAIYSSPRQRAYHTASPIAARHGLTVKVMDALCEGDFGTWEGLILFHDEDDMLSHHSATPIGQSSRAIISFPC